MGFRNSEANAASRETENVTSFQVREQNVEMQKLRKPFTKDKFSPPEMAFFVGGWNEETPTLLPSWTTAFLLCAHFRTKDFT